MVIKCDACEAPGAKSRCSACKVVVYCNTTCAKQHWKAGHKSLCKAMVENRQRIEEVDSRMDSIIARLQDAVKDEELCCVCLENALTVDNSFFLPCNHFLCGECIYKLPEELRVVENEDGETLSETLNRRARCPLCRAELPRGESHMQYLYECAGQLLQRANRLPEGSEDRLILCAYSRSQSKLIDKFFLDLLARETPSRYVKANYDRMKPLLEILEVDTRLCEGTAVACISKAQELLIDERFSDEKAIRVGFHISIGESYIELKEFDKAKLEFFRGLKIRIGWAIRVVWVLPFSLAL